MNMKKIKESELVNVTGGIAKVTVGGLLSIGGLISFLIGAINGYLRPLSCSSEK